MAPSDLGWKPAINVTSFVSPLPSLQQTHWCPSRSSQFHLCLHSETLPPGQARLIYQLGLRDSLLTGTSASRLPTSSNPFSMPPKLSLRGKKKVNLMSLLYLSPCNGSLLSEHCSKYSMTWPLSSSGPSLTFSPKFIHTKLITFLRCIQLCHVFLSLTWTVLLSLLYHSADCTCYYFGEMYLLHENKSSLTTEIISYLFLNSPKNKTVSSIQ